MEVKTSVWASAQPRDFSLKTLIEPLAWALLSFHSRPMGHRIPQITLAESAESAEKVRPCDWPGCHDGEGQHRAPRTRDNQNSFYWFCLEHIRQYNAKWNYYSGMSDNEVEHDVRYDTVWHRPSWRMDGGIRGRFSPAAKLKDPYGFFEEKEPDTENVDESQLGLGAVETQALVVLDLRPPVTIDTIKARYKELVKRHHPDANGGDKRAEEKFKLISHAYQTIMNNFAT